MISNDKKAVIHIAKSQVDMTEEEYRALLESFGVSSSKDLDNQSFNRVMDHFIALGFKSRAKARRRGRKVNTLPTGKKALMKKLEAILLDLDLPWAYADSIAKKRFKVEAAQWLDPDDLRKVVQMLIYHQNREHRRKKHA